MSDEFEFDVEFFDYVERNVYKEEEHPQDEVEREINRDIIEEEYNAY